MPISASALASCVASYSKQIDALRSTARSIDALVEDLLLSGHTIDDVCVEGGFTMELARRLVAGERFFDLTMNSGATRSQRWTSESTL